MRLDIAYSPHSSESVIMRRYRIGLSAGLMAAGSFLLPFHGALAQGKSHSAKEGHVPPGQAKKKVVTADQAIVATREVLVSHGYVIVRVDRVQETRVVYYRRGNMGRGKGKGPIEKIVIRPEPDRVVFVSQPPRGLMIDINLRLGM
jgi:hypothetical protein